MPNFYLLVMFGWVAIAVLGLLFSRVARAVVWAIIRHPLSRTEIYVERGHVFVRVVRPDKISAAPGPPDPSAGVTYQVPPQAELQETLR
jgi:hypothetical protein